MRPLLLSRAAFTTVCLGCLAPERRAESAHEAMAAARQEVATKYGRGGVQTWGAYQHYGDPNFRIIAPTKPGLSRKKVAKPRRKIVARKQRS